MAKKMPRRLVALSASAVATMYVAGLLSTQTVAQAGADAATTKTTTIPTASLTSVSASPAASPIIPVVGASASPTAAATSSGYASGTYTGTGTSRFGNVYVSVTVASGTITNVQITKVTTSYPVSRIASLPAHAVQNQTANVNVVSGATYSSQAFRQAVQQALSQALAAS